LIPANLIRHDGLAIVTAALEGALSDDPDYCSAECKGIFHSFLTFLTTTRFLKRSVWAQQG